MALPVLGWATMRARCPLPIGAKRSTTRKERSFVPSGQAEALRRKKRRKVLQRHPLTQIRGRQAIYPVKLYQRIEPLPFPGQSDFAFYGVTRAQPVPPNKGRRHIHIIWGALVAVEGRTKKPMPLLFFWPKDACDGHRELFQEFAEGGFPRGSSWRNRRRGGRAWLVLCGEGGGCFLRGRDGRELGGRLAVRRRSSTAKTASLPKRRCPVRTLRRKSPRSLFLRRIR